ncbi:MAG: hypothetical protein K2P06_09075, partial [Muribaculaceae bacterium]|nr:hypothetical protein [Muribaculaceae bacterium]
TDYPLRAEAGKGWYTLYFILNEKAVAKIRLHHKAASADLKSEQAGYIRYRILNNKKVNFHSKNCNYKLISLTLYFKKVASWQAKNTFIVLCCYESN